MAELTTDQKISKLKTVLIYLGAYTVSVINTCKTLSGVDLLEYLKMVVVETVQEF